jgi:hypothetical protein
VIRLRIVYGSAAYCRISVFSIQYSDGSAKFAAAPKNSETKRAPEDLIDTKLMRCFS